MTIQAIRSYHFSKWRCVQKVEYRSQNWTLGNTHGKISYRRIRSIDVNKLSYLRNIRNQTIAVQFLWCQMISAVVPTARNVSNAADRSNKTRKTFSPLSNDSIISFVTVRSTEKSQLALQSIHGVSPVTPFSSQENKSAVCESAQAVAKNSTKDHHKWKS